METTKVSLARLVQLKDRLNNEINEVRNEVGLGAFVEKTADIETNAITLDEWHESVEKLNRLQNYLYALVNLISKLNTETVIVHEEQEMNIQTALIKAKLDRALAEKLEALGRKKQTEVTSNGNFTRTGDRIVIERVLDAKEMLKTGKNERIIADRLSRAIEMAGVETFIHLEDYPSLKGVEEYL